MTADYIICRLNNGYTLSDSDGDQYFRRLHDLLTYIKDTESEQAGADQAIDASFRCEDGTCHGE